MQLVVAIILHIRFIGVSGIIYSPIATKYTGPLTYDLNINFLVGGKKFSVGSASPLKMVPVYVAPLSSDKFSKGATLGSFLQGTATFAKVCGHWPPQQPILE